MATIMQLTRVFSIVNEWAVVNKENSTGLSERIQQAPAHHIYYWMRLETRKKKLKPKNNVEPFSSHLLKSHPIF